MFMLFCSLSIVGDGAAQRRVRRQIERNRHRRKLSLVVDRERLRASSQNDENALSGTALLSVELDTCRQSSPLKCWCCARSTRVVGGVSVFADGVYSAAAVSRIRARRRRRRRCKRRHRARPRSCPKTHSPACKCCSACPDRAETAAAPPESRDTDSAAYTSC